MPPDIGFAIIPDIYYGAVLGEELPYRVISSDTSIFTEGYDYLIL